MSSVKVGHFRIWDGREYLSAANLGEQVSWRVFELWMWSPQRTWWVDCWYKLQCPGIRAAVLFKVPRSLFSHCRKWKAVNSGHGTACFKWSLVAVKMCAAELLMLHLFLKQCRPLPLCLWCVLPLCLWCVLPPAGISPIVAVFALLPHVSAPLVMLMFFFHSVYCNELTLTGKLSIAFWRSSFSFLSLHFPARYFLLSIVTFVLVSDRIRLGNRYVDSSYWEWSWLKQEAQ